MPPDTIVSSSRNCQSRRLAMKPVPRKSTSPLTPKDQAMRTGKQCIGQGLTASAIPSLTTIVAAPARWLVRGIWKITPRHVTTRLLERVRASENVHYVLSYRHMSLLNTLRTFAGCDVRGEKNERRGRDIAGRTRRAYVHFTARKTSVRADHRLMIVELRTYVLEIFTGKSRNLKSL